jgi:hypothetical protein
MRRVSKMTTNGNGFTGKPKLPYQIKL